MPLSRDDLADRYPTALVTGASSGIGQAVARHLLQAGLTVYGTSRHPHHPDRDQAIHWLPLEGQSTDGITSFIDDNRELLDNIGILVNNAGAGCFGSLEDLPEESLEAQFTLLLEAPARLTRAVLPGMRKQGKGIIANISSLAALFPLPYMSGYSAGKSGLSAFTQSLVLTGEVPGVVLIDFQAGDFRTAFNRHMPRHGELSGNRAAAWQQLEANLAAGPDADRAAKDLLRAMARGRSGTIRSGGFFQTRVAPLGIRLFPRSLLVWATRRYFHLSA